MTGTLLCADIGNSAIKLAVVAAPAQSPTVQTSVVQVCQRIPHPHLAKQPHTIPWPKVTGTIEGCVVASVTNAAQTQAWLDIVQQHYGQPCPQMPFPVVMVQPQQPNAFQIDLGDYPPEQLGADRYVNLITAKATCAGQNVVIVDAGTATTVDWFSSEGRYRGGVILPGPDVLANSLQQATARLPRVSLQWGQTFPGQSTQQCLQTGLSTGYVGMLSAVLARGPFQPTLETPMIVTGGHGATLLALLEAADHPLATCAQLEPHWTVDGLAAAWRVLAPVGAA